MTPMRSRSDWTPKEFESLQFWFGFILGHRVQFPKEGAIFYQPSVGKVGLPVLISEAGKDRFFDEVMRAYDFFVDDLTPKVVNKIIGFDLAR